MGQALVDSIVLVKETGYSSGGERIHPSQGFGLPELANAVQSDDLDGVYHKESLRALRQRLLSLHATGLFSNDGTPLSDLLVPGRVSVILLERLPDSYRTAVVSVLTRRAFVARGETAFAEKRLALDPDLNSDTRKTLEDAVALGVPKTVIVLDEAQSFLAPGPSSPAREVFVRLVKEGRNIGLSATLATQQPSALDRRILSQVETFIAHQLVTESDIKAVRDNLKSGLPESINFGRLDLDLAGTLRHLDPGVCFVSSADMNTMPRRAVIVAIRPRATVHGGIEL
ncbi:MAG: hypothetical protein GKR94_20980 [Gammaproteobacteria bacterium]|nr:hypothetical protein [Gammaproteobacteria bacterium]